MGAGLLSRSPYDLLPNSPFVRRVREDSVPPGIPLVSIYSRHDVVCPWWASVLVPRPGETSMHNVPVEGVGHTALTYDPGIYLTIRRYLMEASSPVP